MSLRERSFAAEVEPVITHLDKRLRVSVLGSVTENNYPIYLVTTHSNNLAKNVLLSAGIHGDEPAGVYALLDFLNGPIFKYLDTYNFTILPCLNPWGFENNIRENMYGVDINRSFEHKNSSLATILYQHKLHEKDYALAINLHEDNTDMGIEGFQKELNPRAFFMYESVLNGQVFGPQIIRHVAQEGIEICREEKIYADANHNGVVFSLSIDGEFEQVLEKNTKSILVPETPTCWSLEKRIHAQKLALSAALNYEYKMS